MSCHESDETECLPKVNPMRIKIKLDWNKEKSKEKRRGSEREKKAEEQGEEK